MLHTTNEGLKTVTTLNLNYFLPEHYTRTSPLSQRSGSLEES